MSFPGTRDWGLVSVLMLAGKLVASDAQWEQGFFSHSGLVNAVVADERGRIFAGGEFPKIDNWSAFPGTRNLAEGDGERWWSVGGGVNGGVRALALKGNDLYVGGNFTQAGTVAATNLARWDGTNWWPVGAGVNGTVNALAVIGDDLYVGGQYSRAGETAVNSIAKWDGATWSDIGGVFIGANSGVVRGIFVEGTKLYVGGTFDRVDETPAAKVAVWDGAGWEALGVGTNAIPSTVNAVAKHLSSGRLFAGGVQAGPAERDCPVYEWTGGRWVQTPLRSRGDTVGGVRAMACFRNDLYVGAALFSLSDATPSFYDCVAKFDGTNWSLPRVPFRATVASLAATSNRVYGAGFSGTALSRGVPAVMYYDGTEWSVIGKGVWSGVGHDNLVKALAQHQGSLIIGGAFSTSLAQDCVAAFNGKIWSTVGRREGEVNCSEVLTLASRGGLLLAGTRTGLKVWDGMQWITYGPGGPPTVLAIETISGDIYCGSPVGLWKWNGGTWQQIPVAGPVNALLYDRGILYAAGQFDLFDGWPIRNIAQWNGHSWDSLGDGLDGAAYCLVKRGETLYVGGAFSSAGGSPASRIACWNGTTWSTLGSGFEGVVNALALSDQGFLYAGGNFTRADGRAANHIAVWDGQTWLPMGNGIRNYVNALLWNANKLYVGGPFVFAGELVSMRIAVWNEAPRLNWSYLPSTEQLTLSWPSGFSNYVLEAKDNLAEGQWTPVTEETAISGTERHVTNTVSGAQKFFRLRQQ